MNRRTITILGMLQTGALLFGIVFTALFRRVGSGFAVTPGPGVPQPLPFIVAGWFTHYGALLALLIIGWVIWASRSSSRVSRSGGSSFLAFVSGIILLIALALIGVVCSFAATTPMVGL